jgi:CRP/FNR family transcriptional regulator, anaerobic regulatory protein
VTDSARFALHRPELLRSLTEGERKIVAMMQPTAQRMRAGRILIHANAEHDYVYRLQTGWACRRRTTADGRDQFILVFLPGDLFAVKSLFLTAHTDDIQVLSDSVVQRLHQKDLYRAYLNDPDVAMRCTWQVVEEERRLHSWVFSLGQGTAEERMAFLLTDFRGRLTTSGTVSADKLSFEMPLTQVQLADHLGITSVHVNRVLKSLRDRGIASVRDGQVFIENLHELTRIAFPLLDAYERSAPQYNGAGVTAQ